MALPGPVLEKDKLQVSVSMETPARTAGDGSGAGGQPLLPLSRSSKPQSIRTSQVSQCTVSLSRILDCCLPPNLLPIPGNTRTHPSRPSSVTTCIGTHAQLPYNPTCQVFSLWISAHICYAGHASFASKAWFIDTSESTQTWRSPFGGPQGQLLILQMTCMCGSRPRSQPAK